MSLSVAHKEMCWPLVSVLLSSVALIPTQATQDGRSWRFKLELQYNPPGARARETTRLTS